MAGNTSQTLTATQTDAAGNTSTTELQVTVDTVAPSAPTLNTIAGDNAINASERDAPGGVTISGTCRAGATVAVRIQGSSHSADGQWRHLDLRLERAADQGLGQGQFLVEAVRTDAAGNTSPASAATTVTVDTVIAALQLDAPLTLVNQAIAASTLSGTCEDGATVTNSSSRATPRGARWSSQRALASLSAQTTSPAWGEDQDAHAGPADAAGDTNMLQLDVVVDTEAPSTQDSTGWATTIESMPRRPAGITLTGSCGSGCPGCGANRCATIQRCSASGAGFWHQIGPTSCNRKTSRKCQRTFSSFQAISLMPQATRVLKLPLARSSSTEPRPSRPPSRSLAPGTPTSPAKTWPTAAP